jgi:hypothetical protein
VLPVVLSGFEPDPLLHKRSRHHRLAQDNYSDNVLQNCLPTCIHMCSIHIRLESNQQRLAALGFCILCFNNFCCMLSVEYVLPVNILSLATFYITYILFWTILISVVKLLPIPGFEPEPPR